MGAGHSSLLPLQFSRAFFRSRKPVVYSSTPSTCVAENQFSSLPLPTTRLSYQLCHRVPSRPSPAVTSCTAPRAQTRESCSAMASASSVPAVALRHGNARPMPAVGTGTAEFPNVAERTRDAVLAATEVGFRHFDTASMYGTEAPLGEAVAEATRRGLLASREEAFVTSKLWCTQCHPDLVLPSLPESLRNLQMEYVDLYLIHWPISVKPGPAVYPVKKEDAVPFNFEGVWRAMEECHRLGLAKAIGVSNFTTKHLDKLLAVATIRPAVNQVEMNPVWQQRKVRDYCNAKGIHVTAYSPLGGQWGENGNAVMESPVLAEIARARGKSVAQQGVTPIAKSYKKERLKQNLEIFDWELTEEDRLKISKIPQKKTVTTARLFFPDGEFTSVDPSDIEIVE